MKKTRKYGEGASIAKQFRFSTSDNLLKKYALCGNGDTPQYRRCFLWNLLYYVLALIIFKNP